MKKCISINGFWVLVLVILFPGSLVAQEAPVNEAELDRWRGASLGIRIKQKDGEVFVKKVHEHVADTCPLQIDDRLVEIAGSPISTAELKTLSELLGKTEPDSKLVAVIEREGAQETIALPTYRKELVDIPTIVEKLKSNQIIRDYLKETNRSDYLDTVFDRMVEVVDASQSPREAAEGLNAIIDEINVSHTALLPPSSFRQLQGESAGDLGLTLQRHVINGVNHYFVSDRMPGSIGYESDVLLGDEIIALNDVPLEKSRRLILSGQEHRRGLFFLQANVGENIRVTYRRRQNAAAQQVSLRAREAVPAEDVIKLSARVITSGKNQYGYIRVWNLMSMSTPVLANDVIEEKFEGCGMLVLDLRGRGGLIPAVLAVDMMIKQSEIPVIAITDDLTRSAKEMLSLLIKKHEHVTVVGETTAGAVTGATMMQLPSGNGLMYPVVSTEALKAYTDNTVLEGVGVEPDIKVDFQLPWCGGNDRLLEAAIETGDEQIQKLLDSII
ncbi:MAG: S41 family peptidase [Pirellulaceae bacterium]|nr:S41 family peptidase [Pirellulaceae bacterium]